MNEPLVSIITVTYNAEKYLEQTICSVINQTYKNIEYIIIDGQSTDGTTAIIKQYNDRIASWISEPDKGIYDAMNKGILRAKGELIGIINASDFYQPDAVETVVNTYVAHPQYGIFHGNVNYYFENGIFFKEKKANPDLSMLYKGIKIYHTSFFVTKQTYEKNGLFDLRYKIAGDFDLAMRNYKKGTLFCYVDKVISNFRMGGISSQHEEAGRNECLAILTAHGYSKKIVHTMEYRWKYTSLLNSVKRTLLTIKWVRKYAQNH